MENALAVLIAASLICTGMLATWAATSSRHWFLRASIYVGVLSLLLLVPAYEPFVTFVLQGSIVAAGVWLARVRRSRLEENSLATNRFSLATILLVMVFVAIAAAVGSRFPKHDRLAWQSMLLIGLTGGTATLLGLWVATGRWSFWWLRGVIGLLLSGIFSLAIVWSDWFIFSVVQSLGWPPTIVWNAPAPWPGELPVFTWLPISIVIFISIGFFCFLFIALAASANQLSKAKRVLAEGLLGLCIAVAILPPGYVYYRLMTPLPIPQVELPDPNGYDDFVAAGEIAMNRKFEFLRGNGYLQASPTDLAKAMPELRPAFDLLALGMTKKTVKPLSYKYTPDLLALYRTYRFETLLSLASAVAGRGRLAVLEKRFEDAGNYYSGLIQYGCTIRRGGRNNEMNIGVAISGIGIRHLYGIREEISIKKCADCIAMLLKLEHELEPAEEAAYRDRVWAQRAMGWHQHLVQVLDDKFGDRRLYKDKNYSNAYDKDLAAMRLLRLELALRLWRETHGRLPETLDELVPEYLPAVPLDPFDSAGGELRYRVTENDYVLYSVGRNKKDEGGAKPAKNQNYWSADMSLDSLYPEETVAEDTNNEGELDEDIVEP